MRRLSWLYSQRDPAWASVQLGNCPGISLGADGCDLTTAAMVLSDFGYTINPADLNGLLAALFVNGCELADDALCKAHTQPGDLAITAQVFHFESGPADLSLLVPNDDQTQVAIEIANSAQNVPSHRMRVADAWTSAGAPEDAVLVDDPWQLPGHTRVLWHDSLGAGAQVATAIQKILWYTAGGNH